MILSLTLDLPGDGYYLHVARRLGRTLLEELNAEEIDIYDTEFVVGELCSNVFRHASSVDGRFTVNLTYHADKMVVTVIDKGVGFSFKDVAPVGTIRPDFNGNERIGGFGLNLVKMLSDHVEFIRTDSHGTTVRAEKAIHYLTQADAERAEKLDRHAGELGMVLNK